MRELTCDVLVVGAGGAALAAAIAAAESPGKPEVLIATRGKLGQSGVTAVACSDRMAFHATLPTTEPQGADNWRYHAADIYQNGGFVSDSELAEILAKNSAAAVEKLVALGVPFVRDANGRLDQFLTDGSDYPRACYTGPYTANHISQALCQRVAELEIPVLPEHYVFELAVAAGRVIGAWALPEGLSAAADPQEHLVLLRAGAVILGTGGAGEVFGHHVFPPGSIGDGYAMALNAGGSVVNMEFIQMGLCSTKTQLACSGSMMRAMPRFINERGVELSTGASWPELVFRKGASWPLAFENPTHQIDILVAREYERGNRVFLDFSTNPTGFAWENLDPQIVSLYRREQRRNLGKLREESPLARLKELNSSAIAWLKERGVELAAGELLEIHPMAQHFQGGVLINSRAETTLSGLYAAGEVAGGQHGANRPGGNALLDCQVFGKLAGVEAAKCALQRQSSLQNPVPQLRAAGEIASGEVLTKIQGLMDRYLGVICDAEGLVEVQAKLEKLAELALGARGDSWDKVIEAQNALVVARAIAKARGMRAESRGAHLYFTSSSGEPSGSSLDFQRSLCLTGNKLQASWIKW